MKNQSKNIYSWGETFFVVAILLFVVGLIAWLMGEGSGLVSTSIAFFMVSPILKGLAILVKNAEEEIDCREKEYMKHLEEE